MYTIFWYPVSILCNTIDACFSQLIYGHHVLVFLSFFIWLSLNDISTSCSLEAQKNIKIESLKIYFLRFEAEGGTPPCILWAFWSWLQSPSGNISRWTWGMGQEGCHRNVNIGLALSDEHLKLVQDTQSWFDTWAWVINMIERRTLLNPLPSWFQSCGLKALDSKRDLAYLTVTKELDLNLKVMDSVDTDQEIQFTTLFSWPQ